MNNWQAFWWGLAVINTVFLVSNLLLHENFEYIAINILGLVGSLLCVGLYGE